LLVAALLLVATVAAMGYYNYRLTGNPLQLPYVLNEKEYAASPRFYFLPPIKMPVYHHEAIRRLWEWDRKLYEAARANPLAVLRFAAPSSGPFYLFNLIGVAALAGLLFGRRTIVLSAVLILALPMAGVLMQKAFLEHYLAPMCGAWLLLAAAGMEVAGRWHEKGRMLVITIIGLSFGMSAPLLVQQARAARTPQDISNRPLLIQRLERQGGRHLVIVRYGPQHDAGEEWVYNRADIDSASVVWARDMGEQKNRELLDYYKEWKVWALDPDPDPLALQPYDSGSGPPQGP